ncbi:hypothetical protein F2Q70_00035594 [Brassica cretica]|uniref:Uncharacterized protein n=1 Tax=Brassica cretica TaxID=69181 RepID=A0A8S9JRU7_BRACR|nr:hypothetical protein F2Q70_00035594 [Brassica cretica]
MVRAGEGLVKRRQEGARASLFATIHYELAQFHVESLIMVLPSFSQVGARGGASAGAGPPTPSLLLASCSPLSLLSICLLSWCCSSPLPLRSAREVPGFDGVVVTGWCGGETWRALESVGGRLLGSSSGFLVSCGSGVSRLSRPGVRRRWGSSRLFAVAIFRRSFQPVTKFVWIAGTQRRLCKPPTSSVIAGAQRRLCKPPTSSMIAGAQRRLCKPPTSSVIAGAQRRLCKPPTRRLWECRDGLLYAWRYTYIHMRKCGAYMVVVLCIESVVCGLASYTSRSNSPVTHPSFSSLSGETNKHE